MTQDLTRRALLFGRNALENEDGATSIEYGLLAAMIGIAIIIGARRAGRSTNRKLNCISRTIDNGRTKCLKAAQSS